MKIVVFTTLFPNSKMPDRVPFIKARVKHLADLCEIRVVAPIPYFPRLRFDKRRFLFNQIPLEEEIEGLKVYHPRYFITPKILRSFYGIFMFLSVFKFIKNVRKNFDFDLIDAHFVYPDGLAAVLLGKALRKKVIINARGTDINWYPKFWLIRKQIKYVLNKAGAIISVSDSLKDAMVKIGCAPDKIKVIPNGVDQDKFFPVQKTEVRKALGLPTDKRIILSIGNLIEGKGFHILMEAVKLTNRKDVHLIVVGEGSYRPQLEKLIQILGLGKQVSLVGQKPHNDLHKWYSAADIFCLISAKEGRPNVVLESLSCGTPVITMNNWGLSNLVNNDSGFLLDSYESQKVAGIIDKVLEVKWDQGKVKNSVRSLSWQDMAKNLYKIFQEEVKKEDILFFSSDDWNSGLKTSKYHLSTRLANENRVFFINSLGMRTPTPSGRDAKKIFTKLTSFLKGAVEVRKNLFVYTPIVIPFQGIGLVRYLNKFILFIQIKRIMKKFQIQNPIVWTFLPNSVGVIKMLPKKELIYYIVDDMSAFKGVPKRVIKKFDEELTRIADFVFAVSKELFNKKQKLNVKTF